jgi:serine/threonine protein kinase
VYVGQEINGSAEYVLKYYGGDGIRSGQRENQILSQFQQVGIGNIPVVKQFFEFPQKFVLIVSPVGIPILPAPSGVLMSPQLIWTLLKVLESAHEMEIVHRDVKPENIYLNSRNEIILSDWGSSAPLRICSTYEGTPLYGEQNTDVHTPSVA